jgi:copper chaperone
VADARVQATSRVPGTSRTEAGERCRRIARRTKESIMTNSTYRVAGMTCGHCVNAVSSEIKAIDGVTDVAVDLDAAGTSTVTVSSTGPLQREQVVAALDEAGDYRLVDA